MGLVGNKIRERVVVLYMTLLYSSLLLRIYAESIGYNSLPHLEYMNIHISQCVDDC